MLFRSSRTVQNQNLVLVSGDEFDGVYEANFTLAEGSRSGIWIAESGGGIRDVNGFQRVSLTTSFNVLSENSDVCPPEIISALTVPSIVDTTNENASFKVRLRIIHAAGVNQTSVGLSTIYNQSAFNETSQNSNFVLIAGDE